LEYGICCLNPCVITDNDKDPFTPRPISNINKEFSSRRNQQNLETLRAWSKVDHRVNDKLDSIKLIISDYIEHSEKEKTRKNVEILLLNNKINELTKEKNNFRDKWIAEKSANTVR
jgi:hypothetical protein